jgi:hypothetical protein
MSDDKPLQSRDDNGFPTQPRDLVQKTPVWLRSWLKRVMCKPARCERRLLIQLRQARHESLSLSEHPCPLGTIVIHENLWIA